MGAQMVSRYALPMRLRADACGRAVPAPTASHPLNENPRTSGAEKMGHRYLVPVFHCETP